MILQGFFFLSTFQNKVMQISFFRTVSKHLPLFWLFFTVQFYKFWCSSCNTAPSGYAHVTCKYKYFTVSVHDVLTCSQINTCISINQPCVWVCVYVQDNTVLLARWLTFSPFSPGWPSGPGSPFKPWVKKTINKVSFVLSFFKATKACLGCLASIVFLMMLYYTGGHFYFNLFGGLINITEYYLLSVILYTECILLQRSPHHTVHCSWLLKLGDLKWFMICTMQAKSTSLIDLEIEICYWKIYKLLICITLEQFAKQVSNKPFVFQSIIKAFKITQTSSLKHIVTLFFCDVALNRCKCYNRIPICKFRHTFS